MQSISQPPATDSQEWTDLVNGIRFYENRKYSEATEAFLKIIETYPGTPLLAEAQWLLAKSYDASGRKGAAVRELRIFLKNFPESPHQEEARSSLVRLENTPKKVIAAYWSPNARKPLKESLHSYINRGINTVIITGVSEQGGFSRDGADLQTGLHDWIEMAHLAGFQVIVRVPLRELGGLRPEWRDQQWDIGKRERQPIPKLDLFNAEVKQAVLQVFRELAAYPIDGIYVDAFAYRMDEGWTSSAAELYQNLFFERMDPQFLNGPLRSIGEERSSPVTPPFWHWVGWRSRFISKLLKDIQKEVESVRPGIRFGLALPEVVLLNPVKSLVELSLDFLELKRSKFDFYFLTSKADPLPVTLISDTLSRYAIPPQEVWLQWMFNDDPASHFSRFPFQGFVLLNP